MSLGGQTYNVSTWSIVYRGHLGDEGVFPKSLEGGHVDVPKLANLGFSKGVTLEPTVRELRF